MPDEPVQDVTASELTLPPAAATSADTHAGELDTTTEALPDPAPFRVFVWAKTDIGCRRTNNEDAFGYDPAHGLCVVCDGMGGGPNGEISSSTAVETLIDSFAASSNSGNPVSSRLLAAFEEANSAVWQLGQLPENKGMGTTAVALALDVDHVVVGNVGDSRAYVVKGGSCTQLTIDHSYINELIRNGTLTIEDAKTADLKAFESVICRAIGAADTVEPEFFSVELEHGLAILMASDGLTRYVQQDEIPAVIAAPSAIEDACGNLIELAKQRGGADNITCLLLLAIQSGAVQ
jgi:protein phosphatase